MSTATINLGSREPSSIHPILREHGAAARSKMYRDTLALGGTTLELATLKVPGKTHGYFVGGAVDYRGERIPEVRFTRQDFTVHKLGFLLGRMYADRLTVAEYLKGKKPVGYMGTWLHEGIIHVDSVDWFETLPEAVGAAMERGERAIYDVSANGAIDMV